LKFRHAAIILGAAAIIVFLVEPLAFSGPTPLIGRVSSESRTGLYEQIVPVAASLLGFFIAAVAILAGLDSKREIVAELKRGEAFALLIANMLVAILLLFVLTFSGLAGSSLDPGCVFRAIYEWLTLAALGELALSGFYFALVTYKVAVANEDDTPRPCRPDK
jgi:hypothetical protein